MSLRPDVSDALLLLQYPSFEESLFEEDEIDVILFSDIISWLSMEIHKLLKLESNVHKMDTESDFPFFKLELNAFIRELNAPFSLSLSGPSDNDAKLRVMNYLCGELFAARLLANNQVMTNNSKKIEMKESETAKQLKNVACLTLGKPPDNVTSQQLFAKICEKLNHLITSKQLTVEEPLLIKKGMHLSEKQWNTLSKYEKLLSSDYSLRRETLVTRCDCTVGSFKWKFSDDKDVQKRIEDVYNVHRNKLEPVSTTSVAHALAARLSDCDFLLNSVVSTSHQQCLINAPLTKGQANAGKQQRLSLHKFVIGYVPDRGGRPSEQVAPVNETFEDQQRQREGGSRGGGHRCGRGGHQQKVNAGKLQGAGWNQHTGYAGDQRGRAPDYGHDYAPSGRQQSYHHQNQAYYQPDYRDAREYGYIPQQQEWHHQDSKRYNTNFQEQRGYRRGGHRGQRY